MIYLHEDCGHHWFADELPTECPACGGTEHIVETRDKTLPIAEPIYGPRD